MQTDKKRVRTNMYWLANAISFPGGGKRSTHRMFLWGKRLNMTPDQCWDEENMIRLTHQVLCHIGPFMYRRFGLQENCSWNNTNIGSVLFSPQAMYITRWEGCGSPAILFRLRATCVSPSPVEFNWESSSANGWLRSKRHRSQSSEMSKYGKCLSNVKSISWQVHTGTPRLFGLTSLGQVEFTPYRRSSHKHKLIQKVKSLGGTVLTRAYWLSVAGGVTVTLFPQHSPVNLLLDGWMTLDR